MIQELTIFGNAFITPAFRARLVSSFIYALGFGGDPASPATILAESSAGAVGTYIAETVLQAALDFEQARDEACQCGYDYQGQFEGWWTQKWVDRNVCVHESANIRGGQTTILPGRQSCPPGYVRIDQNALWTTCEVVITDSSGGCDNRNPRRWTEAGFSDPAVNLDKGSRGSVWEWCEGLVVERAPSTCEVLNDLTILDSCDYATDGANNGRFTGISTITKTYRSGYDSVCDRQWIRDIVLAPRTAKCTIPNYNMCYRGSGTRPAPPAGGYVPIIEGGIRTPTSGSGSGSGWGVVLNPSRPPVVIQLQ